MLGYKDERKFEKRHFIPTHIYLTRNSEICIASQNIISNLYDNLLQRIVSSKNIIQVFIAKAVITNRNYSFSTPKVAAENLKSK